MAPQFLTSRRFGALVAAGALVAGATTAVLLADPASAMNGATCTVTDPATGETATDAAPFLHGVSLGDQLAVSCTGLPASTTVAVADGNNVAYLPSVLSTVGQPAFADAAGAHVDLSSASGTLSDTYPIHNFTIGTDPAASCNPGASAAYVNAGLACFLAIANPNGTAYMVLGMQFGTSQPTVTPSLTTDKSHYGAGQTITLGGAHWWGTPSYGSGNATATAAGIPAPTLLLDGAPVASNLQTTGASWTQGAGLNPGGDLSGSFAIPTSISTGGHTLTVIQPDTTPYTQTGNPQAGTVVASAPFTVDGPTASAVPGTGNTGTVVTVTGDNWAPNTSATLSFSNGANPSTGRATVNAAGHLTGSITVAASDPVGNNPILVSQTSNGTTLSASAPFAVSNIPALKQEIDQQVDAGTLSDSQSAATVTMSSITLNGSVQTTTGNLSTVTVIDGRGSFGGWSLTGQLEGDFTTSASSHNSFPGSNLSWTPAVSTAVNGQNGTGDTSEVQVGPAQALSTSSASSLAAAASGGGGGSFACDAALSLKVPATIHSGLYTTTLDINLG